MSEATASDDLQWLHDLGDLNARNPILEDPNARNLILADPRMYDGEATTLETASLVATAAARVHAKTRHLTTVLYTGASASTSSDIKDLPSYKEPAPDEPAIQQLTVAVAAARHRAREGARRVEDPQQAGMLGHQYLSAEWEHWLPLAVFAETIDDDAGLATFILALLTTPKVLLLTTFQQVQTFALANLTIMGSQADRPGLCGIWSRTSRGTSGHYDDADIGIVLDKPIREQIAIYAAVNEASTHLEDEMGGLQPPRRRNAEWTSLALVQLPAEQPARFLRLLLEHSVGIGLDTDRYVMGEDIICPLVLCFIRVVLRIAFGTLGWPETPGSQGARLADIARCLVERDWRRDRRRNATFAAPVVAVRNRQAITRDAKPRDLAQLLLGAGLPGTVIVHDGRLVLIVELDKGERHGSLPLFDVTGIDPGFVRLELDQGHPALPALRTVDDGKVNDLLSRHSLTLRNDESTNSYPLANVWIGRGVPVEWTKFMGRLVDFLPTAGVAVRRPSAQTTDRRVSRSLGDQRMDTMAALLLCRGLPLRIVCNTDKSIIVEVPPSHTPTMYWLAHRREPATDAQDDGEFFDTARWELSIEAPATTQNGYAVIYADPDLSALLVALRAMDNVTGPVEWYEWRALHQDGHYNLYTAFVNLARVGSGENRLLLEEGDIDNLERCHQLDRKPPLMRRKRKIASAEL